MWKNWLPLKDRIDEMLPAPLEVMEFDLVWRVVTLYSRYCRRSFSIRCMTNDKVLRPNRSREWLRNDGHLITGLLCTLTCTYYQLCGLRRFCLRILFVAEKVWALLTNKHCIILLIRIICCIFFLFAKVCCFHCAAATCRTDCCGPYLRGICGNNPPPPSPRDVHVRNFQNYFSIFVKV